MFNRVLVANRGEIAVRVIRSLRDLEIESVAVYSTVDREAMHAQLADHAICIGPAKSTDSYANPVAILSAAISMGCDAIHPGYGFLSERADFAKMCEAVGITFIGPRGDLIDALGNKQKARETMLEAGIPITPGSSGSVYNLQQAEEIASQIGYPLMIKAADGGGGKGMRRVDTPQQLETMFNQAQMETQAIYGNQNVYMEKIIFPARHIEVQIVGDHYGNVVHLGERDCSLQRHHQKIIEFAPAINLSPQCRQAICQTAVKAAQALNYNNVGTIEFLVDAEENFYFMEMNTRLQVEHPVTESITGIDLVKTQLRVAAGLELEFGQEEVIFSGFSMECRLNAENPREDFRPSAGRIERFILPGGKGVRTETSIYSNYALSPFYDSMIAKIIVHGKNQKEAFSMMRRALVELVVDGVETNTGLLLDLIEDPFLQEGQIHTRWVEEIFLKEWDLIEE